jgi:exodeoxyribonuclease V gamma subunit
MGLHLTIADRLEPLADHLGDTLANVGDDPFDRPLVVVPSDGVRSWLVSHLARRHHIVANVEFVFPGEVVRRILALRPPNQAWEVGPLTWAVHHVQCANTGTLPDDSGLAAQRIMVARAIADRFDHYALRRPTMIHAWERGRDVDGQGRPLPADQNWQPALWRRLVDHLGTASNVGVLTAAAEHLQSGRLDANLPVDVHLFGLTGLPGPQLDLVCALSHRHNVRWWVPSPTLHLWRRVASLGASLDDHALARSRDPSADILEHPLGRAWSTTPRESLLLLARAVSRHNHQITIHDAEPPGVSGDTLLSHLQEAIRQDTTPPGAPTGGQTDLRRAIEAHDRSITWHRCHGAARQVEVLRDELIHLLNEHDDTGAPRYHPRDIAVLCPDVTSFAPLLEAAFAGDPTHGVPVIPLRIADRSLRRDLPLFEALIGILDVLVLTDVRFRASDVLGLLDHAPIRLRFTLDAAEVGQIAAWVEHTNIRWGLDRRSQDDVGIPADVTAFSWRSGLDQLILGAALPDGPARLGCGETVPAAGIEGDLVQTLGKLADLMHALETARDRLSSPADPDGWYQALAEVAHLTLAVEDDDAWHWDLLHRLLDDLATDARLGGWPASRPVAAEELARLVVCQLTGLPGRARFGTGAVTLSSLVALRGVPHPVICLLGLDGDLVDGSPPGVDDLLALDPNVGDRDPGRELRATLLDALLAAGERLVVVSTGHDLRTNAEVPPAVPLAELIDLIDATVRPVIGPSGDTRPAHHQITIDHPRQAWSERNFVPGELGRPVPFSHDRGALQAALQRQAPRAEPSPPLVLPAERLAEWDLDQLIASVEHPIRALLRDRLGVALPEEATTLDDLVPLHLNSLAAWKVNDDLLQRRLEAGLEWSDEAIDTWEHTLRRAGRLPPLVFGTRVLSEAHDLIESLVTTAAHLGLDLGAPTRSIGIDVELSTNGPDIWRRIRGEVTGVVDDALVVLTPSLVSAKHLLQAWFRLAALTATLPSGCSQAVVIGRRHAVRSGESPAAWHRLSLHDRNDAHLVLALAVDLAERARRSVVPFMAKTGWAWFTGGKRAAEEVWQRHDNAGECTDAWVVAGLGRLALDELLALSPASDEDDPPSSLPVPRWGEAPSRFGRWSHRVWSTFAATVHYETDDPATSGAPGDVT